MSLFAVRSGGSGVLLGFGVFALIVLVSRLDMVMCSCCMMSSRRKMRFSGGVRDSRHD
jgi:hypothetical protein